MLLFYLHGQQYPAVAPGVQRGEQLPDGRVSAGAPPVMFAQVLFADDEVKAPPVGADERVESFRAEAVEKAVEGIQGVRLQVYHAAVVLLARQLEEQPAGCLVEAVDGVDVLPVADDVAHLRVLARAGGMLVRRQEAAVEVQPVMRLQRLPCPAVGIDGVHLMGEDEQVLLLRVRGEQGPRHGQRGALHPLRGHRHEQLPHGAEVGQGEIMPLDVRDWPPE